MKDLIAKRQANMKILKDTCLEYILDGTRVKEKLVLKFPKATSDVVFRFGFGILHRSMLSETFS